MTRRDAFRSLVLCLGLVPCAARANLRRASGPVEGSRRVRIEDEFSPLRSAIVHDANNATDVDFDRVEAAIAVARERGQDHPESGAVSGDAVKREIGRYRDVLRKFGVAMIAPETVERAMSQIFTRDPCFAIGETVYFGSLLDEHRALEFEGLEAIRRDLPRVVDVEGEEVLIEGGDVMVLDRGRTVLVGTNANTNAAGFNLLANYLRESGTRVLRIPHRRLHLDCCLSPLPNGSALVQGSALSKQAFPILKSVFKSLIPLDRDEARRYLAANLLWLDPENVVSGLQARRTNERLRSLGYTVHPLDFTHVKRLWGSFRCATCPILRG